MSRLLKAVVFLFIIFAAIAAFLSIPLCADRQLSAPRIEASFHGKGELRAGAGEMGVAVPFPVVAAGYAPPRPTVVAASAPIAARALVLEQGGVRFGLVTVDLLTMPESLTAMIRAEAADLKLSELWCAATHAHSSVGAYDPNVMSEVAGTGAYRSAVRKAIVAAAVQALQRASEKLTPVAAFIGEAPISDWVMSRNSIPTVDTLLTRLSFADAHGPVAQVVLLSAHPTLAPRPPAQIDPDYPGWLAADEERRNDGVTLVLQSAGGNASVRRETGGDAPGVVGDKLAGFVHALPMKPLPNPELRLAHASTDLPAPDASRLTPWWARGAASNFLCASAPKEASVSVLELAGLRWVSVPGEPTAEAGRDIADAAGGGRVVGLVNGYIGYIDRQDRVKADEGESRRQYFTADLGAVLAKTAALAKARADLP